MIVSRAVLKIAGRFGTARKPGVVRSAGEELPGRSDVTGQFLSRGQF